MTDEQKAALEWLEALTPAYACEAYRAITVLKGMLVQPRMPEVPRPEALRVMRVECEDESRGPAETAFRAYRALYAHLTKPKTKLVWCVEPGDGRVNETYLDHDEAMRRMEIHVSAGRRVFVYREEVPT